jgi:hypothetical protein
MKRTPKKKMMVTSVNQEKNTKEEGNGNKQKPKKT